MIVAASALEDISDLRVSDLMSRHLLTVYEGWSIKRLAGFFVKHNLSAAPVVASDDELVGVVALSDVVKFESKNHTEREMKRLVEFYCGPYGGDLSENDLKHLKEKAVEYCTVNSIMTPEVVSVDIGVSALDACKIAVNINVDNLFVTKDGKLVGVLSAMDFLRKIIN
ncbi:MAG: hypothetical protein COA42_20250 [Alteromonadaceae bacterium]|nr:MAG: hypothetical protein COA42_20250 [Alteromonadaceae bacterium]